MNGGLCIRPDGRNQRESTIHKQAVKIMKSQRIFLVRFETVLPSYCQRK